MLEITAYSKSQIESGLVIADGLISIRGAGKTVDIEPSLFNDKILALEFDDVPVDVLVTDTHTWHGPTEDDLMKALEFGRKLISEKAEFIAVHCDQGKSRSPSIALAIMADHLGSGHEDEAVARILSQDTQERYLFNPRLIKFADKLLVRNGLIEKALRLQSSDYKSWCQYWEKKTS